MARIVKINKIPSGGFGKESNLEETKAWKKILAEVKKCQRWRRDEALEVQIENDEIEELKLLPGHKRVMFDLQQKLQRDLNLSVLTRQGGRLLYLLSSDEDASQSA